MNTGIINYGLGNVRSLENTIKSIGYHVDVVSSPKNLDKYDKIILPGVGSYSKAMELIINQNWQDSLLEYNNNKKFILGICLGMQILSTYGEEIKITKGLGLIEGKVVHLKKLYFKEITPHIGWNSIIQKKKSIILNEILNDTDFYFVHSYIFKPNNQSNIIAETNYGVNFCSIVNKDNVFGTQFHPEKSSGSGRQILKNFLNA